MLRRLIGEDIDLVVRPREQLWLVKVDPGQFEQVIMNLVVNARDAMPDGGKLTIETANVELDRAYLADRPEAHPGEHVQISVSDTGCGMDAATKARVFEPFFTTKEFESGTGLGLATVYGIVSQSGGHVEVYSEPGLGTTFKVYIPREKDTEAIAEPPERPATSARGTETILFVEDEPGVRTLARAILEKCGYVVLDACEPYDALALVSHYEKPIDLLVTDVVMPNMSGRQLVERLLRDRPGLRVLYISGYADDAVVRHGIIDAGTPFLQKPFTPDVLAQKVREVLNDE
jgi:CheY-like chemotaxis protein